MRLAPDPITIRIGGEGVTLSPSLRAATRIITAQTDITTVLRGVLDGNLTIIAKLITEGSGDPANADRLFAEAAKTGVRTVLSNVHDALIEFVLALAGHDPDTPVEPAETTGPVLSPAEYHAQLFGIATGWLGWTPKEAWNATPAEIIAARAGRTDLIADVLKAVFGSGEEKSNATPYTSKQLKQIEEEGRDPAFDRAGLRGLKNKGRKV